MRNTTPQQKVAWQASRWISIVLNPSTFTIVGLAIRVNDWWKYIPLLLVLPVAFYLIYTRYILKQHNDNDVTQKQRLVPLIFNLLCLILAALLFDTQNEFAVFQWLLAVGLLNILAIIFTPFYRISLHMIAVGGLIGFFLIQPLNSFILKENVTLFSMVIFVPTVYWARFHQKAHTHEQLLTGLSLGIFGGMLLNDSSIGVLYYMFYTIYYYLSN